MDPLAAEIWKGVLRWELFHPEKNYPGHRDRMVLGALAARRWALAADYDPRVGPYGEILYRNVDPRNLVFADGFWSPHHPACPWVIEQEFVPLEEAEGAVGWENNQDLKPEGRPEFFAGSGSAGDLRRISEHDPEPVVTVVKLWERRVFDTLRKEGPRNRLAEHERHMACLVCGFRGPRQATQDFPLPIFAPGACPECQGDLDRIDEEAIEIEELAYEKGKRLTIMAPNQSGERIFAVGSWPHKLRTVPYFDFQSKPHPAEQIGSSVTFSNWTMQVSSNTTLRDGIEHMRRAKPYHLLPRVGVEDERGEPWQGGDHQSEWIYYTGDLPQRGITTLQGAGLPPAWNTLFQAIQGVFRANMGTTDLGLTPSQSKDIAVGTIRQLIETGELPVEHVITWLRRDEAPFIGALADLVRATYTPARLRRIQGPDGRWQLLSILGRSLPNVDIMIVTNPTLIRLQQSDVSTLIEFAGAPPQMRKFLARRLNIPVSEVQSLEEEERRLGLIPGLSAGPGASGNGNTRPSGALDLERRLGGMTHGAI